MRKISIFAKIRKYLELKGIADTRRHFEVIAVGRAEKARSLAVGVYHILADVVQKDIGPEDMVLAQFDVRTDDAAVAVVVRMGVTGVRVGIVSGAVALGLEEPEVLPQGALSWVLTSKNTPGSKYVQPL